MVTTFKFPQRPSKTHINTFKILKALIYPQTLIPTSAQNPQNSKLFDWLAVIWVFVWFLEDCPIFMQLYLAFAETFSLILSLGELYYSLRWKIYASNAASGREVCRSTIVGCRSERQSCICSAINASSLHLCSLVSVSSLFQTNIFILKWTFFKYFGVLCITFEDNMNFES